MKDLVARSQRPVLRELASRRTLLAFDFDGTLAPIVRFPGEAGLTPGTARLLRAVAADWPCAVISGRARADLLPRLAGVRFRWVVGNHGVEDGRRALPAAAWRARVRSWRRALRGALGGRCGIEVEDKGLTLTIHFRRAPDPAGARRAAVRAARDLRGARTVPGKMALNVLPAAAPGKGDAVELLVRRGRFERVLFVGDDVTDESVFRRRFPVPVVSVRVGRRRGSGAAFWVPGRAGVDRLLALLARARSSRAAPRLRSSPAGTASATARRP
ncbi:MAG TPA: trehalose-phosphatase [Anaeromyxobacteraceae bacterium]